MAQLKKLIKIDIIKLKSTQIIWFHFYIPALGLLIFLSYYAYTPWNSFGKVMTYFQVLCIVFPILIGIITSIVAEQENLAGEFQNILIAAKLKYLSLVSKLIILLLLGTLSTFLAVIGFYLGFSFIADSVFSFGMYLAVTGILLISNVFMYIFHLYLSFRFSKGVSIGVGIVESLVSALFLTGMGDGRWPFVPSSWSIRFVGSLLVKHQSISNISLDPALKLGIILAIVATFLSLVFILIWFTSWEGNKAEE